MSEVGVSEAIREAIKKFGNEAGKEVTNKIKDWVRTTYPHLSDKCDTTTFASTLSNLRKKAREEAGESVEEETESVSPLFKETPAPVANRQLHPVATKELLADADRVANVASLPPGLLLAALLRQAEQFIMTAGGVDEAISLLQTVKAMKMR